MRVRALTPLSLAICFAALSSAQRYDPRAQAELDRGVLQYKKAEYKSAAEHLKKAVQLNPTSITARLYLARIFADQYVLDLEMKKNTASAAQATEQFQEVLKLQPANTESMTGLAYLLARMNKPDEARRYYEQAIAIDHNNVTAYDGLGIMDWWTVERKAREARQQSGDQKALSAIADPACPKLRAEILPVLDRAIAHFIQAFAVNQDDETAAGYLMSAYAARAELECGDAQASLNDTLQIPIWGDRAQQARKKKPEQPSPPSDGFIL